ncbi:MAG TPA: hypothetical protein VNG93_00195 [Candidatus Dormibacteraeota bacterium]|nr:hypothetical protein [Candidatus Dormibacteraeota bacterium]
MTELLAAAFLLLGLVACLSPLYLAIRARRRLWIALGAAWLLLALLPLMAFAIPEVTYWAAWARCGSQPAIASNFAAGDWYDLPGDIGYGPSLFASGYYCSARDAERAGYHRGLGPAR